MISGCKKMQEALQGAASAGLEQFSGKVAIQNKKRCLFRQRFLFDSMEIQMKM